MSLRIRCGRNWVNGSIVLPPISEILSEDNNPALPELLPGLGGQSFYDDNILQQLLRYTVPLL